MTGSAAEKAAGEQPVYGELILAVARKDVRLVADLLERGADPNEADKDGETVVMRAVVAGFSEMRSQDTLTIVDLLVKWGADPYKRSDNDYDAFSAMGLFQILGNGGWDDAEAFRDVQVVLTEAPERHRRFMEERRAAAKAAAAFTEAARKIEEDKKIAAFQERMNGNARGFKPSRQKMQGGP